MTIAFIELGMTVDEIMRRWPETIRVMIRNRMLCIGCPIGKFHNVGDAAAAHDLDQVSLSKELLEAMRGEPLAVSSAPFSAADEAAIAPSSSEEE